MKTPPGLQRLIEEGVIDEVIRPLKSGKEAAVYVVRCGAEIRCAKVYKDVRERSFHQLAQYQEGRRVRGSRQARAMGKNTRYGRKEQETAWKNTEVDALYRLAAAGVRVPQPFGFFEGVLVMELVCDAEGHSAPRLGEIELMPETAREFHAFLIRQIVLMLCAGLIHGDLSEYNVLVDGTGPVIIDLPQAIDASANNNALPMLIRDVRNMATSLSRAAPELLETDYANEMWALFERSELKPDTVLTGVYVAPEGPADLEGVMRQIEEARDENDRRQRGREAAEAAD
jgi:RIO kinase 1